MDGSNTWNIVQLGIGFMLLFAGMNIQSSVMQMELNSVANDTGRVDEHAGYFSLSIGYGFMTFGLLVAPPIIAAVGVKWAVTIGSSTYVLFLAIFFYVETWSLYLMSAIAGLGGAFIWIGQGNYLALNSDEKTAGRNSGILWAIYTTSQIISAILLYVIFLFTNEHMDQTTILICCSVFTSLSVLATLVFLFLPSVKQHTESKRSHVEHLIKSIYKLVTIVSNERIIKSALTFKLALTRDMVLLTVVFIYTGIELTFWTGIYSTSLAFTNKFSSFGNFILAYNALAIGVGQLIGGTLSSVYGERMNKYGRHPIIILGCFTHIVCFVLIFINIPSQAAISKTDDTSIMQPSMPLAVVCGTLLGFGDSAWNTQLISLLATMYKNQSAEAFAIMYFFQCLLASVTFFCSSVMQLHWLLAILSVTAIGASGCFYFVELRSKASSKIAVHEMMTSAATEIKSYS